LHKQVLTLAGDGKSPQQIIDAFVAQYGESALMTLPREGFNLFGYFLPAVLVFSAALLLIWTLNNWTRRTRAAASSPTAQPDATPEELERLRRELDRLDA
jgi:cytochrome c-type biogenesis protein CcmH